MQQEIRLLALDMDGTVLDDDKHIGARTMAALRAAIARGVEVVPATGRTVAGTPEEFMALPGLHYALGSNGATVVELATGRHLVELPFAPEQALGLCGLMSRFDCLLGAFIGGEGYVMPCGIGEAEEYMPPNLRRYLRNSRQTVPDLRKVILAHPNEVEKYTILYRDLPTRDAAWAAVAAQFPDVEITTSLGCNMELNAHGVTKGRGLAELARVLGLRPAQVMACGDSGNDLAMIEYAGLGVAMGNADPDIKAAAQYVTLDNNHDGVAAAVERFILGRAPAPAGVFA